MEVHHTSNLSKYLEVKRSKVKVARSRGPSDKCWPTSLENEKVWTYEHMKIGRRVAHAKAITRYQFQLSRLKVKGQGHQVD